MSRLPWTAFYWEDWRIATAHLTFAERGAYISLLQHYYQTGKPLQANATVLLRVCSGKDQADMDTLQAVLEQFFVLKDGVYHNKRANEEIHKRLSISSKRARAGAVGGKQKRSKSQAIATANAKQLPIQSQSHIKPPIIPLSKNVCFKCEGKKEIWNYGPGARRIPCPECVKAQ